ncbi:MAG: hypothetical protein J5771_07055 [Bacteroidales bacterium]|nr:hypothetical protein [Bacteroidales bacterium]
MTELGEVCWIAWYLAQAIPATGTPGAISVGEVPTEIADLAQTAVEDCSV